MERRNMRKSSSEEESLSLASSGSKSCASSLTIDGSWFKEIRAHKLRIVAFVSRFHETKLKRFCSVQMIFHSEFCLSSAKETLEGEPELWPPEVHRACSAGEGSCAGGVHRVRFVFVKWFQRGFKRAKPLYEYERIDDEAGWLVMIRRRRRGSDLALARVT
ncbi:hypothetical protein POTOM_052563 [Populus tomentosa]|uniref:Uncharacterized protein n=1 Tax=Populus tomentosa TaxID=118781 RepID=A0A8X7YED3_POPTO|nr:hypothetical protein POTOM_052563 [Populus tomentosa]